MDKLNLNNISWSERLAVIKHFDLTNSQAQTAFGVTADEISVAEEMQDRGSIDIATDVDYSAYENVVSIQAPVVKSVPTSIVKPVTATKPAKVAKKRGRKGSKIVNAFTAVPTTPTNADAFTLEYNVSMAVLKQAKRFDKTGLNGAVRVKKDRAAGVMMIWRDVSE